MKKYILGIGIIVLLSFSLMGCSKESKEKAFFKAYKQSFVSGNYEGMYEMLSTDAKKNISEEEFVKRYSNIFSAINAHNVVVKENETEKSKEEMVVPFNVTMDTIAGKVKIEDYKLQLVKENKEIKLDWNESLIFPQMKGNDKVKREIYQAKRGQILDRDNGVLAGNGIVKSVGVHPAKLEDGKEQKIEKMASILDIDAIEISGKLSRNSNPEHFLPIAKVSALETSKIESLVNIKGVIVQSENSRVYKNEEAFGNLVGYVAPITAEELEKNKEDGYLSQSTIGKVGLEKAFEKELKGSDGGIIYIERGSEKIVISEKQAVDGKDIKVAIDSALQEKIYKEMNNEKGASVAVNPITGEVLAMVSSPSYNSNTLVTYKTNTLKNKWSESGDAEFLNRFNKAYSPGSTFKLVTAAIGLENSTINPNEKRDIKGLQWQKDSSWGGYSITRVKDPKKSINLIEATKYSDNIYFAQVALETGKDKFLEGAKNFGIGKDLEFKYPIAPSQISNSGSLDKETLLADTGYGQGEILTTPLDIALMYSSLSNNGKIMQPILDITKENKKQVLNDAINPNDLESLVNAFCSVVDASDGTGAKGKIDGYKIAGKTGTAELKKDKNDIKSEENGWFVATNVDGKNNKKVSISMIIEGTKNKGGSGHVVPKVKNSMEYYLTK